MSTESYKISKRNDGRFDIVDPTTSAVLDDANGYGYKTTQSAQKAAWYKFKGGKEKMDATKKEAKEFWRAHRVFAREVYRSLESNLKEICRGEIDPDVEVSEWATKEGIAGFKPKYLEYLDWLK
jgi:hypothetical protein